jgi:hypothetical protein
VGGFVLGQLGHIPEPGEVTEHAGWAFTVLSMDGRRVSKVRIEAIQPPAPAETEPAFAPEPQTYANGYSAPQGIPVDSSPPNGLQATDSARYTPSDR